MEKSESIKQLTVALVKAQTEIKIVGKEAVNPFFKSKYADLPAIFKEYQRVFLKHGLVVTQIPEGAGLRTTLAHESGEWISGVAGLLLVKNDPQGQGSAITYMRRYAMASICGIVSSEDDDDGNAGSHKEEPKAEPVSDTIVVTGKVDKIGKANKGGYIPHTLLGVRMEDGTDIKFTSKDDGIISTLAQAKEIGAAVKITAKKTEYKGFASIDSVEDAEVVPF
jgi:hypothetical protein